jgi:hypothetical protein
MSLLFSWRYADSRSSILSVALNLISIILTSSSPVNSATPGQEVTYRERKMVTALGIIPILSTPTALVLALRQHTAAATASPLVSYMSSGAVQCVIGPAATTLAWLIFVLSILTGIILARATVAIKVGLLQSLNDEDSSALTGSGLNSGSSVRGRGRLSGSGIELSTLPRPPSSIDLPGRGE